MGVSIWDGIYPSPQLVKEMQEKLSANEKSLLDFAQEFVAELNGEIDEMQNNGRDVCFVSYTIKHFLVDEDKAGVAIYYDNCCRAFNAEAMAIAKVKLESIKDEHNHLVQIYEVYDKNVENFRELREKIYSRGGGNIEFRRPYIKVTLPLKEKPLELHNYEFTAHEKFYDSLKEALGMHYHG